MSNPNARLKLSEWHIYGNESQGRFVARYPEHEVFHQWNLSTNEQNNIFSRNLGFKAYELKDHLGNVRTTLSDVKMTSPGGTRGMPLFLADMITKNEYYPFGMLIDGQSVSPTNYRYSFNTQEISTEINQNHTTAEFWEYDSRSGRRWNLDPKPVTEFTRYGTFQNNPIRYSDMRGDSIFSDKATFDKAKTGFDATFDGKEPFNYNSKNKSWEMNPNFIAVNENLNQTQQETYDRMQSVINSTERVLARSITFDEKVTTSDGLKLLNQSMRDRNASGHTVSFKKLNGFSAPDGFDHYIYVVNNLPSEIVGDKIEGLTWLHEIAGHTYLNIVQPNMLKQDHMQNVEEYENKLRNDSYMREATTMDNIINFIINPFKPVPSKVPVGGSASIHPR